ncbi:MAG: ABC transporter permease [Alicyclobacillus shizuokensis]|nr:ABC transporter permease [Alicyclobacillus shizuokensis]
MSELVTTSMEAVSKQAAKRRRPTLLKLLTSDVKAMVGFGLFALFVLVAIFAPVIAPYNPLSTEFPMNLSPSSQHLFGTTTTGQDLFSQFVYGARTTLIVGVGAGLISTVIGLVFGVTAGYYGGWVDSVIMRFCDFMFNFPFILLIIVFVAVFNFSNIWLLICVIAFTSWPAIARLVRGLFLSLRESEYVLAAQTAGAGVWRIILKHMLPNSIGPLVVNATLLMSNLIGAEAALAIVGFGVKQPSPSWGNVLSGALNFLVLQSEPWAWIPPAFLITLTILCMNFIGDGLRDAFDPTFEK